MFSTVMLNTYDTKVALNWAIALLFCSNIMHIFTKNADVSQNVLLTKCNFFCIFISCNMQWRRYIKIWKSKLIIINFCLGCFFRICQQKFLNTSHTKNYWKLCNLAFKQGYILICVIHKTKVIHTITSSVFLKFCWFLQKKC